MSQPVSGKIYLADQRGLLETSQFRRQSTFNFGAFQHEHKVPFGRLYGFNEETLAGGHAVEFLAEQDSYIVLLPLTGAVAFGTGGGASGSVEVEEMTTIAAPAGTGLTLRNPFADEVISLLHIWVRAAPLVGLLLATATTTVFDGQLLENQLRELVSACAEDHPPGEPNLLLENQLRELVSACAEDHPPGEPNLPFRLSLGRLMGRQETAYKVTPGNTFFAFVIGGAFELEGRLLHEKDGLALWNVAEAELEALSNHALVLVLELLP